MHENSIDSQRIPNTKTNILFTPKSSNSRVKIYEQRTYDETSYKHNLHQIQCQSSSIASSIEKSARRIKSRENKNKARDLKYIKNKKLYNALNQSKTISRNPVLTKVEHSKHKSDGVWAKPKVNTLSTR